MDAVGYNHAMPALQALNAIAPYDGKKDPDAWLSSIQAIADLYGWTEELCLKIARVRLTGPAWNWAQARQFPSWAAFQQQLDSRYGETKESAIARLECCRQYATELVKDFADRYLYNAEKAGRAEDEALIYNFIQRLQPDLKLEVARQRLHSIEQIVTFGNFWTGLLQGAEDMEPTGAYDSESFIRPCDVSSRYQRAECSPWDNSRVAQADRPTPFRDNTNRGPSGAPMTDYRSPHKASHFSPAPTAAPTDAVIRELTANFKRLELRLLQQMQDQDEEIGTLRTALSKQREQQQTASQLNTMLPLYDDGVCDPVASDDYYDIDYDLLASLLGMPSTGAEPHWQYTPAEHTLMTASPAGPSYHSSEELYIRQPAPSLPQSNTCMVKAAVNGMQVDSVVDTSTANSTITLDCLRRLNLDSLIDSSTTKCLNADGRVTAGMGKVPNLVLSFGDFSTLISPTVTTSLDYDMLIGNDVLHRAKAVIDYNRGKMVIQVNPTLSQEIDISLSSPGDSTCFALEAINCSEANASSNSGPEAAHMMLDTHSAVKLTPSCAAATDESPTDQDMTDSQSLSGLCAPALNVDLSLETEEPDVGPPSAAAATTGQQSYLQQPTAEQTDDTADAPQYLIMNRVTSAPSTTAETTEPLGPLSAPEHTVSKGTSLEGFTQAAHMMTEPDAVRFDAALDILGARYTAAPGMPDLLCIELTSKFASLLSLHNDRVSSATAVQPEAVGTSLDYTGTATMPLLPQDNADKCPEAVTIFDPGGCLPPAPWRAVCSSQPL